MQLKKQSFFFSCSFGTVVGNESKATEIFYSTCRIKLHLEAGTGYTECFRVLTLHDSKLSAPKQEVPGRLITASHQIPKMLDTSGYPLKHQIKGPLHVDLM